MSCVVRFTLEAKSDIESSYRFLAERDLPATKQALQIIDRACSFLEEFPFSCRKVDHENPLLREMIIPFGRTGHVALFEIEDERTVTVLAIRHQREDDYP